MTSRFEFEGFEPTAELRQMAKEVLWRAERKAPSQAAVKAQIAKHHEGFEGNIQFSSRNGRIAAQSHGVSAQDTLDSLYTKIKEELVSWKKSRI